MYIYVSEICNVAASIVLGRLVQCEQKCGTGVGGLVYTPRGWKQQGCVWV